MTTQAERTDPAIESAYRRALQRRGQWVQVQRIFGFSPNASTFSVTVLAIVQDYNPDRAAPDRSGYGSTDRGGITQGDRQVVLMARDLADKHFPLPLQKNDRLLLASTDELLNISHVDAEKRRIAGAIDLLVTGVQ